ncbi:MAG: carboxypeptidase regulatory-like domain-containing protein [Planctomycetes bacterium]|nr:carboxypeptidase regulatory-like domain-containing protein [Planctomycetota bacterium]
MAATPPRRSPRLGLVVLVVVALLAIGAWLRWSERAPDPASADVPASSVDASTPSESATTPAAALDAPAATERSAVDTAIPVVDATEEPRTPDDPPAPETADLAARDVLVVRVVDELEAPIFDASVTIRGLRKQGDEGSWYSRRDTETPLRTDREGRARIPYERWTDLDAKTVRVDLVVEHADFIPFNDSSFELSPGEHVITLQQGSMVWVTVWHGSRDRVVADARLALEWEAQLGASAWRREPDGRLSTTKLAPGPHWITATHAGSELGQLASDFTPFELGKHSRLDLELELKPLVVLRGRLDDAVPRPVVGGLVTLNLHANRGNQGLSSEHSAEVKPDGTFELPNLRSASGRVIAICDGWVSKQVPPRTIEEAGWQVDASASGSERQAQFDAIRDTPSRAQPVDASGAQDLVVLMEPSGQLEVRVSDEAGAPLAGVAVSAWPNVYWDGVGSTIVPGRDWTATTDVDGLARITNLPVDDGVMFGAQGAGHQLRKADRGRYPNAKIESGKTTRYELVLEKLP